MKNSNVPEIRFPGFVDDWEQRELGELGKIQSGIGFPDSEQGGSEGIPFYKISDMNSSGNENEMTSANNYVTLEQIQRKNWKPIENVPAIIFAKVGAAIMLNRKRLVTSPFFIDNNTMAYSFNDNWNISFGKILFETINLPRYVQVGALPSYNGSDIESIEVKVPRKKEQEKIGLLFKQFDDTIALHQQELTTLKKTKQGFLQKMFPKEGEKVPEIRFPGFTDDWEERKLGEVTEKIGSGKTPKGGSSVYSDKGIPLLRSQNIYNDRVNFNDIVYITKDIDDGMANSRVLKDDVLLNITGASIGRSAVYIKEHPANVNQHVCIIRPNNSADSFFIQLNITSTKGQKEIELNQAGGGREGLNFQQIAKMTFFFPKKEEQAEIGVFFKQLDDTIALHQRELEILQETKKAFLQKMFV